MNQKISKIINQLSDDAKRYLQKKEIPRWIDPMLATLTETYFSNKNYLYEHKWDGIRIIAYKRGDTISLMTRNKINANSKYPQITKSLHSYDFDFIVDGEVIATQGEKSDFGLLQQRHQKKNEGTDLVISYQIFDILYIDGYDLTNLSLLDRKFILQSAFRSTKLIQVTDHVLGEGLPYFKEACEKGWEGVIAKEIHSRYESALRSQKWLKFKCFEEQEFVIGGFTRPSGNRLDFGALLLGYYEEGKLLYAGKVGTGFSVNTLETLGSKLEKMKTTTCPFESIDIPLKNITWVKPTLVAEIKFSEWTSYNKLRHPRFMGLRPDKKAKDVTREKPLKLSKA